MENQIKDLAQFNNKTVLVLGGQGFIGSNFIRALFEASPEVRIVVFDKFTYSGNPNNLADVRAKYQQERDTGQLIEIKGDIGNFPELSTAFNYKPDYVINFAAETHVDRSIHTASMEFIDTNVIGVHNILELVKASMSSDHPVVKYVQVSTDEVYGQLPNPHDFDKLTDEQAHEYAVASGYRAGGEYERKIVRELIEGTKFHRNSPFKPNVPYSATKAAGDCLCNAWHHTWHVPVVATHCSNNYGPYQYPEKLVPFWVSRIMQGKKIPIYGDGLNIRDWVHVDDHVTALGAVLLRGEPGKDYLIGADNEKTNLEMAAYILEALGKGGQPIDDYVEYVQDRPGHDRRYAIDHSDITRELGWEPKYGSVDFVQKLRETIQWYVDHKDWVEEVIKRTGVANPHIDLWEKHGIK